MLKEKREVAVPFCGFYDSFASLMIDNLIESEMDYYREELGITEEELDSIFSDIDYSETFDQYVRCYFRKFVGELDKDIEAEFKLLQSPREYNFTTDRIFADFYLSDLIKIYKQVDKEKLKELVKERFTSYDGFHSFYSGDIEDWGEPNEWDHNQWETVLMVAVPDYDELNYDVEFELHFNEEAEKILDKYWEALRIRRENDRLQMKLEL